MAPILLGASLLLEHEIDFQNIAKACKYDLILQAETRDEIIKCMKQLNIFEGKVFLEIRLKKGSVKIWEDPR